MGEVTKIGNDVDRLNTIDLFLNLIPYTKNIEVFRHQCFGLAITNKLTNEVIDDDFFTSNGGSISMSLSSTFEGTIELSLNDLKGTVEIQTDPESSPEVSEMIFVEMK